MLVIHLTLAFHEDTCEGIKRKGELKHLFLERMKFVMLEHCVYLIFYFERWN
jgi:hypothetical protein